MLGLIGSNSSESLDTGHDTFRIKQSTCSTATAVGRCPKLGVIGGRCLYVVCSWQIAVGVREALCPHWSGHTQTGDRQHAVMGTSPHAPLAGTTGAKDGLDFARR